MGILFDEVSVEIEAPQEATASPAVPAEPAPQDPARSLMRMLRDLRRREARLFAD